MKNLKLLICPLGNSVDSGDGQFSFQGRELKNISPTNIPETSFDYVINVWEGLFDPSIGEQYKEFYDEEFFDNPHAPGANSIGVWKDVKSFLNVVNYFVATNGNTLHVPYPMARVYSDIFCVDKDSLFEFSRLCGIFSTIN